MLFSFPSCEIDHLFYNFHIRNVLTLNFFGRKYCYKNIGEKLNPSKMFFTLSGGKKRIVMKD